MPNLLDYMNKEKGRNFSTLNQKKSLNAQELLKINQELQSTNLRMQQEMQEATSLIKELSEENDNLRKSSGSITREESKNILMENKRLKQEVLEMTSLLDKTKKEYVEDVEKERDEALEEIERLKQVCQMKEKAGKEQILEKNREILRLIDEKDKIIDRTQRKRNVLIVLEVITMSSILLGKGFLVNLVNSIIVPGEWLINTTKIIFTSLSGVEKIGYIFLLGFLMILVVSILSAFMYLYRRRWKPLSLFVFLLSIGVVNIIGSYLSFVNVIFFLGLFQIIYVGVCMVIEKKIEARIWERIQSLEW